jgi:ABC-type multidrug transport system fused ATPase/permease subunit
VQAQQQPETIVVMPVIVMLVHDHTIDMPVAVAMMFMSVVCSAVVLMNMVLVAVAVVSESMALLTRMLVAMFVVMAVITVMFVIAMPVTVLVRQAFAAIVFVVDPIIDASIVIIGQRSRRYQSEAQRKNACCEWQYFELRYRFHVLSPV